MAGALTISTLNNDTGVLATQNGMTGIAKAWAKWAGANGSISSSFNVSSITRNSTGNYTVNFTTAMPLASYSVVGCINRNGSAADAGGIIYSSENTTSVVISTYAPQGTFNDVATASIAIFSS